MKSANKTKEQRIEDIDRAIEKFYLREAQGEKSRKGSDKARTLARKWGRRAKGDRV